MWWKRWRVWILGTFTIAVIIMAILGATQRLDNVVITGQVVGSEPNNRLVVVFVDNEEVGRDVTHHESGLLGLGEYDGAFEVRFSNFTYGFSDNALGSEGRGLPLERSYEIEEGQTKYIKIQGRDSVLTVKCFSGDVDSHSLQIRTERLALTPEGKVVLWTPRAAWTAESTTGASTFVTRLMLSLASFTIVFGLSPYFLASIFPWKRETLLSKVFSFATGFFLAVLFANWIYSASEAEALIGQITQGFLGVITSVLSILFIAIGIYLFWKKVKAYLKP